MNDDKKAISVWNGVLTAALKVPGARVKRDEYLKKEFSKYYDDSKVLAIIENGYKNVDVDKKIIDKIAKSAIKYHTTIATSISFAAGIPGGWWMAGTIPADLTQYYFHVIVIAQKLAYIYGWPSFEEEEATDEFLGLLTLFLGVMSGLKSANVAIGKLANSLAKEVGKRVPQKALTKNGLYNIIKQIAKWFGVKLTKESFGEALEKIIPFVGAFVSGTLTMSTFLPMANRLRKYLVTLPLAKGGKEYVYNEEDMALSEDAE